MPKPVDLLNFHKYLPPLLRPGERLKIFNFYMGCVCERIFLTNLTFVCGYLDTWLVEHELSKVFSEAETNHKLYDE